MITKTTLVPKETNMSCDSTASVGDTQNYHELEEEQNINSLL